MSIFPEHIFCSASTVSDGNMSFRFGNSVQTAESRRQFLLKNCIDFKQHIAMKCDHSQIITTVTKNTPERGAETQKQMLSSEVLVTQEKGLALVLLTADCLPVSFYDPITQTIALAHFSRQTIAQELPKKTIVYLKETHQVHPSDLLIYVGPHISTASYHFSSPLPSVAPAIAPHITETDNQAHINLVAALRTQLGPFTISEKNINISEIDTATSPDYFSYFQSKKENTPDGRFATVLMMR